MEASKKQIHRYTTMTKVQQTKKKDTGNFKGGWSVHARVEGGGGAESRRKAPRGLDAGGIYS